MKLLSTKNNQSQEKLKSSLSVINTDSLYCRTEEAYFYDQVTAKITAVGRRVKFQVINKYQVRLSIYAHFPLDDYKYMVVLCGVM
jgi:hypothetical protein